MRSDGDVKRDVEDEIRYDADVESTDIAASVDGDVRFGASDSRSDPEIACDLIANLNEELPFSWRYIKCTVKDGWITLGGELEWNYQLLRASDCARRVNGVAGIKECIKFAARASAAEINARIKDASMLGAQRELRSWAQGEEPPQRGTNQ
jgi:osmotically-inducible protein OsmY